METEMDTEYEWIYSRQDGFAKSPLPRIQKPRGQRVIIRPRWIAVCGSDLYLMKKVASPLRLGHEWIGTVQETGPEVQNLKAGDVVTSTATLGCLSCPPCSRGETNFCEAPTSLSSDRLGALRSVLEIDEGNLVKVEGSLLPQQVLLEIVAVAEQAIEMMDLREMSRRCGSVLILGAGSVGLLVAHLLRIRGIAVELVERMPARTAWACDQGFTASLLAEALTRNELRNHFDWVVDATSDFRGESGGFRFVPIFLKRGGQALIIGKNVLSTELPEQLNSLGAHLHWMRGVPVTLCRDSSRSWNQSLPEISELLRMKIFSETQLASAFAEAQAGSVLKAVIEMSATDTIPLLLG